MSTSPDTNPGPDEHGHLDEGKVIASFPKNSRELVCIGLDEWQGEARIFARVYVKAIEGDELVPTREGVTLPVGKLPELHEAVLRLGEVVSSEKLVARIAKSSTKEVRVGCNVFKKIPLIYLRTFASSDPASEAWFPTRQGISLRVELYPALAEAMRLLADHVDGHQGGLSVGTNVGEH